MSKIRAHLRHFVALSLAVRSQCFLDHEAHRLRQGPLHQEEVVRRESFAR